MSHIVHRPPRQHDCAPGWRTEPVNDPSLPFTEHAIPPNPWEYPAGTVWQCDCGRTWVSKGALADNMPGFCDWRRELRFERRRRERRKS